VAPLLLAAPLILLLAAGNTVPLLLAALLLKPLLFKPLLQAAVAHKRRAVRPLLILNPAKEVSRN
jgi:hypothetical protein